MKIGLEEIKSITFGAARVEENEKCIGFCRFTGCSHTKEKECGVRMAVDRGDICESRYANYVTLYEEAQKRVEWKK